MSLKVAVCIATSKERKPLYDELLKSLRAQTFQDFKIYTVSDVSPIGLAKNKVVVKALRDHPDYIQMIDDDDTVEPDFLKVSYETISKEHLYWVVTWGRCFGDRKGAIHSYDLPLNTHRSLNRMPSWGMFNSVIFTNCKYGKTIAFGEDWDLWLQLKLRDYNGRVIEQELYNQRWHGANLNTTKKYNFRHMRSNILKRNGLSDVKYRFHIPAYVHLPCSERYIGCAFTQKVVKLAKMLLAQGHEVYVYGAEGSDVPCTEFIQTHTLADIRKEWGDGDNRYEVGYNHKDGGFRHDFNTAKTETTLKFYANCITEIEKRKLPDDFLLLMQGQYHKPIADATKLYLTCEPGIGYRGSIPNTFRAFESSYMQNFTYGSEHPYESINGSHYDRVIPNYFDPKDFVYSDKKEDYYLYIGRIIGRKGVNIAIETTEAIGAKLILVGQADEEIDIKNLPAHCEYRGFAEIDERKKLMAGAIATFTPTIYLEAFAGTHVESMLSGTPPITTNFGVFPGTIPDELNGVVGFRCDTLQDFVNAALKAKSMKPKDHLAIRKYGERFLMENVIKEFMKWFDDIYAAYESTTDSNIKGWHRLKLPKKI